MENTNFFENKENILKKIEDKCKNLKCPICENDNMILGEGYLTHDIQQNLVSRQMGGSNIPTVPVVCSNCGFLREFSIGILGLIKKEEK